MKKRGDVYSHRVEVRLSTEQYELLDRLATKNDTTGAEILRMALRALDQEGGETTVSRPRKKRGVYRVLPKDEME
jgi:hypothetical protein